MEEGTAAWCCGSRRVQNVATSGWGAGSSSGGRGTGACAPHVLFHAVVPLVRANAHIHSHPDPTLAVSSPLLGQARRWAGFALLCRLGTRARGAVRGGGGLGGEWAASGMTVRRAAASRTRSCNSATGRLDDASIAPSAPPRPPKLQLGCRRGAAAQRCPSRPRSAAARSRLNSRPELSCDWDVGAVLRPGGASIAS